MKTILDELVLPTLSCVAFGLALTLLLGALQ